MIRTTDAQTLVLEGLVQGLTYLLVLTKSPGSNSLQFHHLADPDPIDHPAHTNITATTVVSSFLCPSADMALVFDAPPATPYHITVIPITAPEF